jgi:hypothetical protein
MAFDESEFAYAMQLKKDSFHNEDSFVLRSTFHEVISGYENEQRF